jgi:Fe-S cluster biogenesis protein NfuA
MDDLAASGGVASRSASDEALRRDLVTALAGVRTRIRGHAGDVDVAAVRDGIVRLDFQGACRGCPAQDFTFLAVVKPTLSAVAGVKRVEPPRAVGSPYVRRRIEQMLKARRTDDEGQGAVP